MKATITANAIVAVLGIIAYFWVSPKVAIVIAVAVFCVYITLFCFLVFFLLVEMWKENR